MIDKHGEIVVANHAYYEVFSPDQQVENKNYIGFIDDSIEKLIIESFRTEKVIYDQIEVDIMYILNTLMYHVSQFCPNLRRNYKVWLSYFMILLTFKN